MKRARSRLGLLLVLGMLTALLPIGALTPAAAAPGDVVINEVDSDTVGTDVLEFVELFDGGSGNTPLDGLVVVFYNGNGDASYAAYDLDGFATDGAGYFILGNAGVSPTPSITFASNGLQNGPDAVALYTADATDFPGGTAVSTTGLQDALVYDTNDSDDAGLLVLLNAGQAQVNEDGAGDKDNHSNQRCPNGSGGALNTASYAQHAPTAGSENTCPEPAVPLSAVGTATPSAVDPGSDTTLEVTVTPATQPVSTGITVTADLTAIGGAVDQAFADVGGNVFSYVATVDPLIVPGQVSISASVIDDDGRSTNATINLTVTDPSAAPVELLLTQYVEGSSFNKAIEVANLGSTAIDLTGYSIEVYSNANLTAGQTFALSGSLAPNDVYVLAHEDADAAILAVADQTTGSGLWNGNDSVVLTGASGVVDSLGKIGENINWSNNGVSTTDNTLCRLDTVTVGDTDPNDAFDPSLEWEAIGNNVFYGLGEIGCEAPVTETTLIHDIQGSGLASPIVGSLVTIEGVVVGDFQDAGLGANGDLNGFFVQEEDADVDADPATSEGILVFDGFSPTVDVAVGDLVRVTGEVAEYFDMTEITNVSTVEVVGTGVATPATVTLPWASEIQPEQYEGMLVDFPQTLSASGNYTQGRYGEVDLSLGGPLDNPTNVAAPGADALLIREQNNLRRIQLDDGSTVQNPLPLPPYVGADNTLRTGDTVTDLTAVMSYSFETYELHPIEPVSFTRVNDRPSSPPDVGGTLTVAAYNVLNYFTTIDDGSSICGPDSDQGCRGADSADEFTRQRDKIISALVAMDADIVGLIEIENHATDAALADLVAGINSAIGAVVYDYVPSGPIGSDAIKVALIYKPASVSLAGVHAVLDSSVDPAFIDTKNRPVLAQTFLDLGSGELVTVAVNHLKSKGSECDDIGDPDIGDMQGNCNLTRTAAANALVNWLATDPTGSGSDNFLITGDLNAYAMEDPITAIKDAGFTDLIAEFVGSGFDDGAYSYNFFSESGYLDHALASSGLLSQVTGVGVWHTNADEPSALNYNDFNQPLLYDDGPYRASDHDPVIVGLELTPTPPVVSAAFNKIWASYRTGLFVVDFSCVDTVDPNPMCVGDINGIVVEDGQKVVLIKSRWGTPWSKMIGDTLFIKDRDFTLTVTGTDQVGNEATATAEPTFRKWRHWSVD